MAKAWLKTVEEKKEEYSDFRVEMIIAESLKSYYAIIDGLAVEPIWISKRVIGEDFRIKKWYVRIIIE